MNHRDLRAIDFAASFFDIFSNPTLPCVPLVRSIAGRLKRNFSSWCLSLNRGHLIDT